MYDATDDLNRLLEQPDDPREAVDRARRAAVNAGLGVGKTLPEPTPLEGGALEWPRDLTLAAPEEIGRMMGVLAGYIAYAESELARAEGQVMLLEYQEALERTLFEETQREAAPKRASLAEIRGRWETSEAGRGYAVSLIEWRTRARLLKGLIRGYEARYAALSRELTRRGIGAVGRGA